MSKNAAIEVYLRTRPTKKKSEKLHIIPEDSKAIFMGMSTMKKGEYINNTKNEYNYYFNKIFEMDAKQGDVFDTVAKDVIDSAFEGFNGTIFAYGQTGSGKTFTMTGSAKRYEDRGLIPRSIDYIFSEANRRTEEEFTISISYLEIYNNDGYDLLSEDHGSKELADLPKVRPLEQSNGQFLLSGLSTHKVSDKSKALNLLFFGDTVRATWDTPMNDTSTRSHCIFIIQIEGRKLNSDVKTISKVHLVDLSGSERVGKTGVDGKLLNEAWHINLSLHHLEFVINSLQKKMNSPKPDEYFIPYRNSLMTMVLRDSLGGNCKTKMISTVHCEDDFLDESISTWNFAMRVAMIKNSVTKNEAVDPNIIIQRLKRENQELKAELTLLRSSSHKEELTDDDVFQWQKMVKNYLENKDPTQKIILSDMLMIQHCFFEMKSMYNKNLSSNTQVMAPAPSHQPAKNMGNNSSLHEKHNCEDTQKVRRLEDEVLKLKMILKQRENEILIFLNILNKKKDGGGQSEFDAEPTVKDIGSRKDQIKLNAENLRVTQELNFPAYNKEEEDRNYEISHSVIKDDGEFINFKKTKDKNQKQGYDENPRKTKVDAPTSKEMLEINKLLRVPLEVTKEQLMDRQNWFEKFRKSYRKNEALNEDLKYLEGLQEKGKKGAAVMKELKSNLDTLKTKLERERKNTALSGIKSGGEWQKSPEELSILNQMEVTKKELKEKIAQLTEIKEEIISRKVHWDNGFKTMSRDFEKWLMVTMKEKGVSSQAGVNLESMSIAKSKVVNGQSESTRNDIGASFTTNKTKSRLAEDDNINSDIEAFYKAKDSIYNKIGLKH